MKQIRTALQPLPNTSIQCNGCDFNPIDKDNNLSVLLLRHLARSHARNTGHMVTVKHTESIEHLLPE